MEKFSRGEEARRLLRRHDYGVLSTQSQKFPGYPYGSFVDYVLDHSGRPVMLLSALAEHTQNIKRAPQVSLTVHDAGGLADGRPRLTLLGEARLLGGSTDASGICDRYLRVFPAAEQYLGLDFAFFRVEPHRARFIAGFAQAAWVHPADLLAMGTQLASVEPALLAQLNRDHANTLACYAVKAAATVPSGPVAAIGLDCDGLDLRAGETRLRLPFDHVALDAEAVRAQLLAWAHPA